MYKPPQNIHEQVAFALNEDIGKGDLTAELIPENLTATAVIISRQHAVICGIPWANTCYGYFNPKIQSLWNVNEGDEIFPDQILCQLTGNARNILTAERTSLNFIQSLSSTATLTRKYLKAVEGTSAMIMDTRKTIPGMRLAQKYAVRVGGGENQRIGLFDGILIKENHISAAGGVEKALELARNLHANVPIQIEVENLEQLEVALNCKAELILLDNFDVASLIEAVRINNHRSILEASGGIDLDTVGAVARTGVDRISVGSLTKHIQAVDLSMRFI